MHTSRYTHSSHRQTECERVGMPGGRLGEYAQERAPLTGREPGRGGLLATLAPLCARVAGEGSSQRGGEGGPHLQAATDRGPRMPAAAERETSLLLAAAASSAYPSPDCGSHRICQISGIIAPSFPSCTLVPHKDLNCAARSATVASASAIGGGTNRFGPVLAACKPAKIQRSLGPPLAAKPGPAGAAAAAVCAD